MIVLPWGSTSCHSLKMCLGASLRDPPPQPGPDPRLIPVGVEVALWALLCLPHLHTGLDSEGSCSFQPCPPASVFRL